MPTAWRLTKTKHISTAFDGLGASANGGRWNLIGTAIAYCSATLSLAALEVLVNLDPRTDSEHAAVSIEFEDSQVEVLDASLLPENWRDYPYSLETIHFGETWVLRARSLVLAVPSAIVPIELNYLINPGHPDFKKLKLGTPLPFSFAPRLLGRKKV